MRLFKALPRVLRQVSIEWMDDNGPRLGAALAFYTLLSLAPVVLIAVAVAAIGYGHAAAQGRLAWEIRGALGPEVARTVQGIIRGAYQPRAGLVASLLGLTTLAFGASSIFVELHDALNTIWHVSLPPDQTTAAAAIRLIRDRLYSFAMVVGIGFLLLASLVSNAWIAAMKVAVPRTATFLLSCLVIAVLFAALYRIVPDVSVKWSDVALGAAIASLLFVAAKELMGLYFAHAGFGSTYSAAGSPIVVLLWVYSSAALFFWGAEFGKVYARTLGSHSDRQP